jgi:ornithine cyclodeaminase/alanine dehydrogenase-like protein (mu-crystallin family)
MSLRILTASDVARITSSTNVQDALNLMALVFHRLSSGMNERHDSRDDVPDIAMPHRISVPTAKHSVLCMPARISPFGTALKVVSVPRSSEDVRGLPASTLVLDEDTGAVRAMINARALTAFRTAAGAWTPAQCMPSADMIAQGRLWLPNCY